MQRVGNLFPGFCSFQNLLLAWRKTRRGSGRNAESALFFQELEKELFALQTELKNETWQPRAYRFFDIYDPKHRTIAVSDFRDRVTHHALVNVLEPVFEKIFSADSYATRQGKGVHAAVFRAQHFLRGHEFFLKTDVEKFFDSVNHNILLQIISRKIKDRRLFDVCEKIIRHGGAGGCGLPIGNRTSQFFANVYLDPLDHFLKDNCRLHGYVRYMDDFVLFENDNKRLKFLLQAAEDFLHDTLQLRLKPSATLLNRRQHGLPFLGRRIFPGIIRLRTENLRRITHRRAFRERQMMSGDISEEAFLHSMNSYWAMLSYYPELSPLRQALLSA
ncbi:MAG: group II intron reverse transcriptase domain-containing protein [Saprospirales bacterium]|nr:group II intron reverse transcriptase domain-containing protein [Saprospirales bacterium]